MVEVIAEIGKNFVVTQEEEPLEVLFERAKELINAAKQVKATIVKFQAHNVEDEIYPNTTIIAPHFEQDRYTWVKRNTYPAEFWTKIRDYCWDIGIEFLVTPMSRGAALMLDKLGVMRWKIGSADITDYPMLDFIRSTGKPTILSSGMSSLEELRGSYEYLRERERDIMITHCVSIYPCPTEKLNLGTIPFLKERFPEAKIGFSDHSLSTETANWAVSLGAQLIEKHFTMDRRAWGPDHKVSLTPSEFRQMVDGIGRKVDIPSEVFGVETKYLQHDEAQYRPSFHKGLYAAKDIQRGEYINSDMLISMRPKLPGARPAQEYIKFVDRPAEMDYKKYDAI